MVRKVLRVAGAVLGGLAVIFIAALALSPYFRRWTFLAYVDVYDYDKLPARTIDRSPRPFQFPAFTEGDWVAPLRFTYAGQDMADEAVLAASWRNTGPLLSSSSRTAGYWMSATSMDSAAIRSSSHSP